MRRRVSTIVVVVTVVGCGGDAAENGTNSLAVDSSRALQIADPELMAACDSIDHWVRASITQPITRTDGRFTGSSRGTARYGCQIVTADTLQPVAQTRPFDNVRDALVRHGWVEDLAYVADGPEGSMLGLRDSSRVCVLQHYWEAGSDDERAVVPHAPIPYDLRIECFREAPRPR